jgi:hypothetical protein
MYNGYFTWRRTYTYDNISLSFSLNEKCFRQKLQKQPKHTFYVQYLFSKNCAIIEIMWKNTVQPDRPQMTVWHRRFACWITKARIQTHTQNMQCFLLFAQQKWLRKCTSILCHTYTVLWVTVEQPAVTSFTYNSPSKWKWPTTHLYGMRLSFHHLTYLICFQKNVCILSQNIMFFMLSEVIL